MLCINRVSSSALLGLNHTGWALVGGVLLFIFLSVGVGGKAPRWTPKEVNLLSRAVIEHHKQTGEEISRSGGGVYAFVQQSAATPTPRKLKEVQAKWDRLGRDHFEKFEEAAKAEARKRKATDHPSSTGRLLATPATIAGTGLEILMTSSARDKQQLDEAKDLETLFANCTDLRSVQAAVEEWEKRECKKMQQPGPVSSLWVEPPSVQVAALFDLT
eukprot:m.271105 g.271105  ORF g.271105 m.271105 type:complete len:216 (+) comp16088_c0_seq9:844-1491(+)